MLDPKILEDLSARVGAVLSNLPRHTPLADLERNVRATLSGMFSQLDLVTREEFEVQAAMLSKCREQLRALEARVAALEQRNPPSV